jgi:hypothetical protein
MLNTPVFNAGTCQETVFGQAVQAAVIGTEIGIAGFHRIGSQVVAAPERIIANVIDQFGYLQVARQAGAFVERMAADEPDGGRNRERARLLGRTYIQGVDLFAVQGTVGGGIIWVSRADAERLDVVAIVKAIGPQLLQGRGNGHRSGQVGAIAESAVVDSHQAFGQAQISRYTGAGTESEGSDGLYRTGYAESGHGPGIFECRFVDMLDRRGDHIGSHFAVGVLDQGVEVLAEQDAVGGRVTRIGGGNGESGELVATVKGVIGDVLHGGRDGKLPGQIPTEIASQVTDRNHCRGKSERRQRGKIGFLIGVVERETWQFAGRIGGLHAGIGSVGACIGGNGRTRQVQAGEVTQAVPDAGDVSGIDAASQSQRQEGAGFGIGELVAQAAGLGQLDGLLGLRRQRKANGGDQKDQYPIFHPISRLMYPKIGKRTKLIGHCSVKTPFF